MFRRVAVRRSQKYPDIRNPREKRDVGAPVRPNASAMRRAELPKRRKTPLGRYRDTHQQQSFAWKLS
jgi:hypothetical protein